LKAAAFSRKKQGAIEAVRFAGFRKAPEIATACRAPRQLGGWVDEFEGTGRYCGEWGGRHNMVATLGLES
jgi:hypothetical protein